MDAECTKCPNCNFPVKNANGDFLYYHYVESDTKIQESTKEMLELPTLNIKSKDTAIYRRIQRDRLEMVLSMNSIEHQVKQYGDTTYKFEYVDDATLNKKTYYRRIIRDPLKEENGGDWYKFMTKPDKEVYKTLCDLYTRQEPDRFKGTIKKLKPVEIIERKSAEPTKSNDGFSVGTEVLYKGENWFIETKGENDMITINRKKDDAEEEEVVNKSELTIVQAPEESKVEDWTPSSSSDEEYETEQDEISETNNTYNTNVLKLRETQIDRILNSTMSAKDKYAALIAIGVDYTLHDVSTSGNSIDLRDYKEQPARPDGSCMYHSVLAATRRKRIEPGNTISNPRMLRNVLYNNFDAIVEQCDLRVIGTELLKQLKRRINDDNGWGGALEMKMIECLYRINISVVQHDTGRILNFVDVNRNDDSGIILVYVNRNHYNWLCLKPCTESPSLSAEEYLSDASIQSEY